MFFSSGMPANSTFSATKRFFIENKHTIALKKLQNEPGCTNLIFVLFRESLLLIKTRTKMFFIYQTLSSLRSYWGFIQPVTHTCSYACDEKRNKHEGNQSNP